MLAGLSGGYGMQPIGFSEAEMNTYIFTKKAVIILGTMVVRNACKLFHVAVLSQNSSQVKNVHSVERDVSLIVPFNLVKLFCNSKNQTSYLTSFQTSMVLVKGM